MALTKMVDGKEVSLTPEEEQAVRDEWKANEERVKPDDTEQVIEDDPMKKVTLTLLMEATGRSKAEIIQMIKDEKTTRLSQQ